MNDREEFIAKCVEYIKAIPEEDAVGFILVRRDPQGTSLPGSPAEKAVTISGMFDPTIPPNPTTEVLSNLPEAQRVAITMLMVAQDMDSRGLSAPGQFEGEYDDGTREPVERFGDRVFRSDQLPVCPNCESRNVETNPQFHCLDCGFGS